MTPAQSSPTGHCAAITARRTAKGLQCEIFKVEPIEQDGLKKNIMGCLPSINWWISLAHAWPIHSIDNFKLATRLGCAKWSYHPQMASGTDQDEGIHELTGHLYIEAVFWGVQQHTQMSFPRLGYPKNYGCKSPVLSYFFGGEYHPKRQIHSPQSTR